MSGDDTCWSFTYLHHTTPRIWVEYFACYACKTYMLGESMDGWMLNWLYSSHHRWVISPNQRFPHLEVSGNGNGLIVNGYWWIFAFVSSVGDGCEGMETFRYGMESAFTFQALVWDFFVCSDWESIVQVEELVAPVLLLVCDWGVYCTSVQQYFSFLLGWWDNPCLLENQVVYFSLKLAVRLLYVLLFGQQVAMAEPASCLPL